MSRVLFAKGRQRKWIEKLLSGRDINKVQVAKTIGVTERTIREWINENNTMSMDAINKLTRRYNFPVPKGVEYLPDYWYVQKGASKGGFRRVGLYGYPGTPEGRKKGGQNSQIRRRLNPEKYLNCKIRKDFYYPNRSVQLAELMGIILGDGGLTPYQLKITLNKETEPDYINYVCNLMQKLFHEVPKKYYFRGTAEKTCNICFSGAGLVEYLVSLGLKVGNKVSNQVSVPLWISSHKDYSDACLMGLIDTDGCIYIHRHGNRGVQLINLGLNYTSHSKPLLDFVSRQLSILGFTPKQRTFSVWLYRESEVIKYMETVKTHSQYHQNKLVEYLKLKPRRGV